MSYPQRQAQPPPQTHPNLPPQAPWGRATVLTYPRPPSNVITNGPVAGPEGKIPAPTQGQSNISRAQVGQSVEVESAPGRVK